MEAATEEDGAAECLAGQEVTSGPQEVMVSKVEWRSVSVTTEAEEAETAATKAAAEKTVENCIVNDRLLVRGSSVDDKKESRGRKFGPNIYASSRDPGPALYRCPSTVCFVPLGGGGFRVFKYEHSCTNAAQEPL